MREWLKAKAVTMLACSMVVVISACGGGGSMGGTTGTTGGTGSSGGTGRMAVAMTDSPACGFDAVNVTVQQLRIHQSAGAAPTDPGWIDIPLTHPSMRIDLLSLTNGILETLGQTPLAAGHYQQMRLVLAPNTSMNPQANSVVPSGGGEAALSTPSGAQSGVKMNVDITIAANQLADFVIDFNACDSVVTAGHSGKFMLKPVLTVTPMFISGVQGFVDMSLANGNTLVSLQDSNGTVVKATMPDSTGMFLLQPVAPGTYTLVITAPKRATAVVTAVPVVTDTVTSVDTAGNPIMLNASDTAMLDGTVSAMQPIDATVAALQGLMLSGGGTMQVASTGVDMMNGMYALTVPVAAPMVAVFVMAPGMLNSMSFSPDMGAAGTYTLLATSDGMGKMAGPVMLSAGQTVMTDFIFP